MKYVTNSSRLQKVNFDYYVQVRSALTLPEVSVLHEGNIVPVNWHVEIRYISTEQVTFVQKINCTRRKNETKICRIKTRPPVHPHTLHSSIIIIITQAGNAIASEQYSSSPGSLRHLALTSC